jgi:hypothetical protein
VQYFASKKLDPSLLTLYILRTRCGDRNCRIQLFDSKNSPGSIQLDPSLNSVAYGKSDDISYFGVQHLIHVNSSELSYVQNLLDGTKANGENKQENETSKKYRSMRIRTLSSIWMIGGFVLVVYMGHIYIWAMIIVIQLFMVKELFTLARASQRERQLPGFRLLNWYVFLMSGTWLCTRYICSIVNVTGLFLNGQHLFPFS